MSKRLTFLALIVIAVGLISYFLIFDHSNDSIRTSHQSIPRNANVENQRILDARAKAAEEALNKRIRNLTPTQIQRLEAFGKKLERFAKHENRSISFIGKIVDQYDNPVPDVEVKYTIAHMPTLPTYGHWTETDKVSTRTDTAGRFKIQGKEGVILEITKIQKNGYVFKNQQLPNAIGGPPENIGHYSFNFSNRPEGFMRQLSTNDAPFVVHAWKVHEAGDLIHKIVPGRYVDDPNRVYAADGKFKKISLPEMHGAISMAFTIEYDSPSSVFATGWMAKIVGDGLMLQEAHDIFPYEAPSDGYKSSWQKASTTEKGRGMWETHEFYVIYDNGSKYGRIDIKLSPYMFSREKKIVTAAISYTLNTTTGSRNLQPKFE